MGFSSLEYASFIVAALAALAALFTLVFGVASVFGVVWFKKTAKDIAQQTAQQAVEEVMLQENMKKMVKEAAEEAARREGDFLYQDTKVTKTMDSTKEKLHD